jgi:hypothetical protein
VAHDPLKPPTVIAGRRHPYVVFLTALMIPSGMSLLFATAAPNSIDALIDPFYRALWGIILIFGGCLVLAGCFWRLPLMGLLIERLGQFVLAVAASLYFLVVLGYAGTRGFFPGSIYLMFGFAAFYRGMQIHLYLVPDRLRHKWLHKVFDRRGN